jgi:hypothetical protein
MKFMQSYDELEDEDEDEDAPIPDYDFEWWLSKYPQTVAPSTAEEDSYEDEY